MSDALLQEATYIEPENAAGSTPAPALRGHPRCAMPARAKGLRCFGRPDSEQVATRGRGADLPRGRPASAGKQE